jgi:hypothetical protein
MSNKFYYTLLVCICAMARDLSSWYKIPGFHNSLTYYKTLVKFEQPSTFVFLFF